MVKNNTQKANQDEEDIDIFAQHLGEDLEDSADMIMITEKTVTVTLFDPEDPALEETEDGEDDFVTNIYGTPKKKKSHTGDEDDHEEEGDDFDSYFFEGQE